jgi:hypothetical protein
LLRETLDSLTRVVRGRSVDAATGSAAARALKALAPRFGDAADRTKAYLLLIDASVLAGDLPSACAAYRSAKASAKTPAQVAEVRKFDDQLGCT